MNKAHRIRHLLAAAILILLTLPEAARAERRLAFVAGVNAYTNLAPDQQLKRAVTDAETVAEALKGVGFEVTRLTSGATLSGFLSAFGVFTRTVEPGDTVLFYFAGHGIGLDSVNYLVPSDIPSLTAGGENVVKRLAVAEPDLISDIQARGARVTVFVIDACRDNPFTRAGTRSLGLARGLTAREPPQGVFSLYSAGVGQQALDRLPGEDRSPNSVFTRVFVTELGKPGVSLLDLGETVREEVARLAKTADHEQVPAVYNQILGARRVLFAGPGRPEPRPAVPEVRPANAPIAPAPVIPAPIVPAPPVPSGPAPDRVTWDLIRDSQDPTVLRRFLAQFRDSPLRREAEERLASLAESSRPKVAALPAVAPILTSPGAECDRLAASPIDLSRPAEVAAVPHTRLDAAVAVPACKAAVALFPQSSRLIYQLARALDVGKQDVEAAALYRRAADLGSAAAMNNLGLIYAVGRGGVGRDDGEAARLFRRSAELGNPSGLAQLGHFYEVGRGGLRKDEAEAARLYRRSAELDYPFGMTSYGRMLASGLGGVLRNDVEAVRLYRRAAAQEEPSGLNHLGLMTEAGRGGLVADDGEAARLYRRAADLGSPSAMTNLSRLHEGGRGGLRPDEYEAARLLRRAAEQEYADAIYRLGLFSASGRAGLPQDLGAAARQYQRAADLGSTGAMNNLGGLYAAGRGGLLRNDREAVRLYRTAAELGNGAAAWNLARFYWQGRGVPRNFETARFWFARAVELRLDRSQARRLQPELLPAGR